MSDSRSRVALMHEIGILYGWATDERETISALSESQAKKALGHLKALWPLIERRKVR